MITTKQFLNQEQERYNNLSEQMGVIWAFSDEQFKAQTTEGVKYTSIGAGGFIPSANVKAYLDGLEAIEAWAKKAKKDDEAIILYELNNYECFNIGDIGEAMPRLEELGYTLDEVKKIFKKNMN